MQPSRGMLSLRLSDSLRRATAKAAGEPHAVEHAIRSRRAPALAAGRTSWQRPGSTNVYAAPRARSYRSESAEFHLTRQTLVRCQLDVVARRQRRAAHELGQRFAWLDRAVVVRPRQHHDRRLAADPDLLPHMLAGLPHDLAQPRPGILQCPMLPDGILQTTSQSGRYRSVPNPGQHRKRRGTRLDRSTTRRETDALRRPFRVFVDNGLLQAQSAGLRQARSFMPDKQPIASLFQRCRP